MILAKQILEPLEGPKGFIAQQGYDAARTNVKYLLNQLQIEKAATLLIRNSIDFSEADPDTIDRAQEQGSSLGNSLIQLDSTIYTVIFIPGSHSSFLSCLSFSHSNVVVLHPPRAYHPLSPP